MDNLHLYSSNTFIEVSLEKAKKLRIQRFFLLMVTIAFIIIIIYIFIFHYFFFENRCSGLVVSKAY